MGGLPSGCVNRLLLKIEYLNIYMFTLWLCQQFAIEAMAQSK
jgi:hypothetical protein